MINKKVVICCPVKNEQKTLNRFFKLISKLIYNSLDYFIIFVESDSTDKSVYLIEKFLKNKKGTLLRFENNQNFNRFKNLEVSRNKYLEYISKSDELIKFDYLMAMDVDGVNNKLEFQDLDKSIKMLDDWTAIFPSQKFLYYDIFALRLNKLLNDSYVNIIKDDFKNKKFKNLKSNFSFNLKKYFFLRKLVDKRFIEVDSAFGGMGLYKLKRIIEFRYDSLNGSQCEHVKLNKDLSKKYGNLFIDFKLINSYGINIHTINGILCSNINFFAKRFFEKF